MFKNEDWSDKNEHEKFESWLVAVFCISYMTFQSSLIDFYLFIIIFFFTSIVLLHVPGTDEQSNLISGLRIVKICTAALFYNTMT